MRSSSLVRRICPLWAVFLATTAAATAQESASSDAQSDDVRAIRQAAEDYVAALNRGDYAALRSMWTSNGDFIDGQGNAQNARTMLEQAAAADERGTERPQARVRLGKIRFLTPDVAIEDGAAETVGTDDDGSLVVGHYTAVWRKHDGHWLLDALRESTGDTPSPADRMGELAWLTGEWVGQTDDTTIIVSGNFEDDGAFLVREFAVTTRDGRTLTGEQRIGWDQATGRYKAWLFDSQGTFGEGYLTHDGEGWRLKTEETLPDGQTVTVSSAYALRPDGELVWESSGPVIDGQQLPAVRVVFSRAAEAADAVPFRIRPALPRLRRDAPSAR